AVIERVVQRIEAADEHGRAADVVVVEQRLGHLLRRADQGGRVAGAAHGRGDRCPQALVVHLRLARQLHDPPPPHAPPPPPPPLPPPRWAGPPSPRRRCAARAPAAAPPWAR